MSEYDFTFDLSMKYTQADFDAITDEEFEKTTEVFLYNRKGEEFHFIKPKMGKWIETSEGTVCSNCHEFPYDDGEYHIANWHSDFCPNCGAKMERSE